MKSEVLNALRKLQNLEAEPLPLYIDHYMEERKIDMYLAEKEFARALKEALDWDPR